MIAQMMKKLDSKEDIGLEFTDRTSREAYEK